MARMAFGFCRILLKLAFCILLFSAKVVFAQNNKDLVRANAYFEIGEYSNAIRYFEYAYVRLKDPLILSKIAQSYIKINLLSRAEKYFQKLESKFQLTENDFVLYIKILIRAQKNDKISTLLSKFKSKYPSSYYYQKFIGTNDSIAFWKNIKPKYDIENLEKINSEYSEISPFMLNQVLYLASNKEEVFIKRKSDVDFLPYYNLYFCSLDGTNFPSCNLKSLSTIISTHEHECAVIFTNNGENIFIAQNMDHTTHSGQKISQSKLFSAQKQNGKWQEPNNFVYNDSSYSYTHPSIDKDNKMLFFASDMKGGFGGTDIYVCINLDGKWTNPINLGPKINTSGNEIYPFHHSDGILYFSSDSHIGYGGYDIFKACEIDGEWQNISNLKAPINSASDDFGYYMEEQNQFGYFSSNRSGGKGAEDIYIFYPKMSE